MQKRLLVLATLAGAMLLGPNPAKAYTEGPWCAIVDEGAGSTTEKCDFRDFESCRQETIGGNRGFCNHNPRWSGGSPALERAPPRRRARR